MPSQDDGADNRVNGLMAAMGKKETENASLRARLAEFEGKAQESGVITDPTDSQPAQEFEDGELYQYDAEAGRHVPFDPPTPNRHNEARVTKQTEEDPFAYGATSKGYPV